MIQKGDNINGYIITRKLGNGGMGEVWAAEKESVAYAIKFCLAVEETLRERFNREYRLIHNVHSQYVIDVFEQGELPDGTLYIIEELGECDLAYLVEEKGLTTNQKYELAIQICQGILDIHESGETHRDIKPSNILIINGIPKIADFGIGKFAERDTVTITTTNETWVSTGYAAPELAKEDGDFRAGSHLLDIYALGGVLYYIFSDGSLPMFFNYKQVSPDIYPILAKCRELDTSLRYQSVHEVLAAIQWLHQTKMELKTMQEWYKMRGNYTKEEWVAQTLPILLKSQGIYELLQNSQIFLKRWNEINQICCPRVDEIVLYILRTFENDKSYWLQFEDTEIIAKMAACFCPCTTDAWNARKLLNLALNRTIEANRWAAMHILHEDIFIKWNEETIKPYISYIQENTPLFKLYSQAIGVEIPPIVRKYLKSVENE